MTFKKRINYIKKVCLIDYLKTIINYYIANIYSFIRRTYLIDYFKTMLNYYLEKLKTLNVTFCFNLLSSMIID